ncbi:MAG TPA: glycosyltransferase [Candidatus Acidoferrum sp.]|nr:glycosyltransferase [Candidatus Acidoferrum sp.]
MRVAFFSECYRPIVNGIVASIDALRDGLRAHDVTVATIAPHMPGYVDDVDDVVRIPSLPLPTPTAYRLCLPILSSHALRDVDVVHVHSPFVTGWMGARYARRHKLPLVFTYHTRLDAYAHYAPFERHATQRAMNVLTRRFANLADAVIVPTAAIQHRLLEIGVRAPISVVPSAIDVARFSAGTRSDAVRAELGAPDERTPLALVVSRLGREKSIELALEALARIPDVHLAIVGEGPHRPALAERTAELRVSERVHFTGALSRERLPDVYASADAFVFPSLTETQGLVLAEALAAGLPIVAADSEVSREVVGRERVAAAEPLAIAAALVNALRRGRDLSAVHLAHERYTVDLQARRVLELYREVLAAKAA